MTLLEELAQLLDDFGLGVYNAGGAAGGSIFLTEMPAEPDTAIAVSRYRGRESSIRLGYDEPNFQFRVRGPAADSRVSEQLAQDIYDAFHGLGSRTLPGGTWLVVMVGNQGGPIPLGCDQNGRVEHTVNFRAELRRQTTNRQ